MVVLRPERVRFGDDDWDGVVRFSVDRFSMRTIEEWGASGAHLMFADVSRVRVRVRVVQEFWGDDLGAPMPGEMGELRMYVSGGNDAGRKLIVANAVVESVFYSSGGSRSEREIRLVCISDDGIEDPIEMGSPG